MLQKILPALSVVFLIGCSTVGSECPVIVDYSLTFQKEIHKQYMDTIPEHSPIDIVIKDYHVLREELRECQ